VGIASQIGGPKKRSFFGSVFFFGNLTIPDLQKTVFLAFLKSLKILPIKIMGPHLTSNLEALKISRNQ